jgi:HlyD family secretion protein
MKRRFQVRNLLVLAIVVLILGAVLYGFIWRDRSDKLKVNLERITVSTVVKGPFQEFIPLRGNVVPLQMVYLDAVQGGRVEEIFVKEGGAVRRGDPILRLSNPALELSVMNQEALMLEQINSFQAIRINLDQQATERRSALIEAEYRLAEARRSWTQKQALFQEGLAPRVDEETTRDALEFWQQRREFILKTQEQDALYRNGQVKGMEAAVDRLQLNLAAVKENLKDLFLRAPVDGQLTLLDAEIGEQKTQGQRLGQIDIPGGYKVRAEIDEYYISRVATGQSAACELLGETYRLTLGRIYPEVRAGRFEVDLEFLGDAPKGIHRGQSLLLKLGLGDSTETIQLPRGGFFQATGGNWAFVLDASGRTAVRRAIRIGRQNAEAFEVLRGLEPGETVVTSGYEDYEKIDKLILGD